MDNMGREHALGAYIIEQRVIVLSVLRMKSILPIADLAKLCSHTHRNHRFLEGGKPLPSQMLSETSAQSYGICKDQPAGFALGLLRLLGEDGQSRQRRPFPGRNGKPLGQIWLFGQIRREADGGKPRPYSPRPRPLGRNPVALPLEGVGGQRNTPSLRTHIELGPINSYSSTPESPTGIEQKSTI